VNFGPTSDRFRFEQANQVFQRMVCKVFFRPDPVYSVPAVTGGLARLPVEFAPQSVQSHFGSLQIKTCIGTIVGSHALVGLLIVIIIRDSVYLLTRTSGEMRGRRRTIWALTGEDMWVVSLSG
jgi:hypothetical protein